MTDTTLTRLDELLATIETSASVLRTSLTKQSTTGAGLHSFETRVATDLGLPFHWTADLARHASLVRIASERLAQLVTPPRHAVFEAAGSFYTTLALQVAVEADIATFLDTEDTAGVPIDMLAQKARLDQDLLCRLMRHLTTQGIFHEPALGVFANTVQSRTMAGNPEFCAHLDIVMHEGSVVAPYWPAFLKDRFEAGESGCQPPLSPFSLYSDGVPFYEWVHSRAPDVLDRGKTFNLAMRGMTVTEGLAFLPVDYPFERLAPGTLIVDVGGGVGSVPALVLPRARHLRFVVQDLAPVISQALSLAATGTQMRQWIDNGHVQFRVQDCFTAQPDETHGGIFLLKNMLHNYPDERAEHLLRLIRASRPATLLVIDRVVSPLLRTEAAVPPAEREIYEALRAHGATSQRAPTTYDLIMGSLHGGRARTVQEWTGLFDRTGFRFEKIWPLRASTGQAVLEATIV